MRPELWAWGRGLLRRVLESMLPRTGWTDEYLEELDAALESRAVRGVGPGLTLWYLRQLLSPATVGFVRTVRKREQRTTDRGRGGMGSGLWMDLRHAWRGLLRDRWATVLIVSTLAVGIGSVSAMYGLGERLFLSGPSHVAQPDRVVHTTLVFDDAGGTRVSPWIPYNTASEIRDRVDAFESGALYRTFEDIARVAGTTAPLSAAAVDGQYFEVLGAHPLVGRFIDADAADGPVVVSYGLAMERFGSAGAAIGEPVRVGEFRGTVVGVAPEGFAGPGIDRIDVWIPTDPNSVRNRPWWSIGRLAEGHTAETAAAQAQIVHEAVDPGRSYRWALEGRIRTIPLHQDPSGERTAERSIARLLMMVVGLVLLIAWVNTLNLLLARITRRSAEVQVRLALGIGRWRLMRLLLVETLLLSALGGLLGIPVAWAEGALVRGVLLPGIAWGGPVLNLRIATVALGFVVLSGLVLSLFPARKAGRIELAGGLSGTRGSSGRRAALQTGMATAQVTLSAALLLCAGLFLKSFMTMRVTDLGLDADELAVVNLRSLDFAYGSGGDEEDQLYERALRGLSTADPGRDVALAIGLPFITGFGMSIHIDGRDSIPRLPGGGPYITVVSGDYFETVGTGIRLGRSITEADVRTLAEVTVIGQSTAEALWPGSSPLGDCVRIGGPEDTCYEVVGVAEDVHRVSYREPPSMQLYIPLGSSRNFSGSALVVRTSDGGGAFESRLRSEINSIVPEVAYVDVRRLSSFLDPEIRPWKLGATMLGLVSLLAVAMSLGGVFAVLSYLVTQRRREIGVRMALGATRESIRSLVLGLGMRTGAVGILLGFGIVVGGTRWLGPLLFETSVVDPVVMITVAAGMLGAATVACLLPAGQAARVDPATSLRSEA